MQTDYARQYENLWQHHWWWQSRKQYVLAQLRRFVPPPLPAARERHILDIGCGNGLFFDELLPFGSVQGIETDASLVHEGRHRERIAVRPFDATFVPPAPLDLVLMLDVLEHLEDDRAAVEQVRRILAPGGIFLLTVPALTELWSQHDVVNHHYRRYTKEALRQVLLTSGFRLLRLRYFFGWAVGPMWLRRLLSPGAPPASPTNACEYDVRIPPWPINGAFYALSRLEQMTLTPVLPWGTSLLAVATADT